MKRKERCSILGVLIIATFFFLSSCGIPTYILLNDLQISGDTIHNSITISGNDESLSELSEVVNDGPGLVLLYSTDSEAATKASEICTEFASRYKSRTFGTVPFYSNSGLVGEFKGIDLYCFKTSDDKEYEKAYEFALNLKGKIPGSFTFETSDTDIEIIYENSVENRLLWPEGEIQTIYLFAAFTAQETKNNNFNNIYWSNLVYVGQMSIN